MRKINNIYIVHALVIENVIEEFGRWMHQHHPSQSLLSTSFAIVHFIWFLLLIFYSCFLNTIVYASLTYAGTHFPFSNCSLYLKCICRPVECGIDRKRKREREKEIKQKISAQNCVWAKTQTKTISYENKQKQKPKSKYHMHHRNLAISYLHFQCDSSEIFNFCVGISSVYFLK